MPRAPKAAKAPTTVEAISHAEKRVNLPTADAEGFAGDEVRRDRMLRYSRDPNLDPQLVWKGKDIEDGADLAVEAPPLFIQEKVVPEVLVENLIRRSKGSGRGYPNLFESFDGLTGMESIQYYRHPANWSNRLILGDSLEVMASLAEREQLRGQVQLVYMDPPYGVQFKANWQVSTKKPSVQDGKLEDATREVEQIKAFRDTWELGVHSYLSYLRDRLVVAHDLLSPAGSVVVQMGEENAHLVRALLDEVFGAENYASTIAFSKTSSQSTLGLGSVFDYLLVYAKDSDRQKFRPLFIPKVSGERGAKQYTMLFSPDLSERRRMTKDELEGRREIPEGWKIGRLGPLTSQDHSEGRSSPYVFEGEPMPIAANAHWKYDPSPGGAMDKPAALRRIQRSGKSIASVLLAEDNPTTPLDNIWLDTGTGSFTEDQIYVVQTGEKVLQRCILMLSDPGDLILDPTCGSGTTAYVAEQWGRRWITIDTSRVALTLARQRLMSGAFPPYLLLDSHMGRRKEEVVTGRAVIDTGPPTEDVRKGFVYRRVPHVTLGAIADNPEVRPGMTPEQIAAAIARSAESQPLYDSPYEADNTVRVAGPFTVESLLPHRALGEQGLPSSEAGDLDSGTTFEQMLLDNLRKAGVQNGRRAERFEFDDVTALPGKFLSATAVPTGNLADQRVAVSIGPRYGTVGADWIKGAAREAMRGRGYDLVLILGFAFDPHALETVEEFKADGSGGLEVQSEYEIGSVRVLLVRMNADLAMGEKLLKKTKAANLFTVFGEPDLAEPMWSEDGWTVSVRGFDVYNPVTGEVRAGDTDDIAMWMIDTDYDEMSFFVRHAYFLGAQDPYERLRDTLKADIDPDLWPSLKSAVSLPFSHPSTGKIAVKLINHFGDEMLSVLELARP